MDLPQRVEEPHHQTSESRVMAEISFWPPVLQISDHDRFDVSKNILKSLKSERESTASGTEFYLNRLKPNQSSAGKGWLKKEVELSA